MKKSITLLFMVALMFATACAQSAEAPEPSSSGEEGVALVGSADSSSESTEDIPSDFSLMNLDGELVTLSDLRGKFVLVNFWATWCIPCRAEMPYLEEISVSHSDQVIVLGINMGEDVERVAPFVEEMGLSFPILLDPPDELTNEHFVRGLPVSFVVAPDGTLAYRRVGEILPEEFDVWLDENVETNG